MKVVFLDSVHEILWQRLTDAGHACIDATTLSVEKCNSIVQDAQGLVIRSRFRMDADFLENAPNLRFIARSGAGMENIDEDYCSKRGIQCFNAPEGNRNAVAEHALGMLLTLFNRLHLADTEVRGGLWRREENRGIELDGKTVGIIGYGNNGSAFARKLRGFDVRVLAYDKYQKGFGNAQVEEVPLEQLFEHADVLSFHIPQNEETLFMGDSAFFEAFRKSIYVVNLSRGKIIRTKDLMECIQNGKILGACLDVLEYEKASFESFFDQNLDPTFAELLASQKILLSPHVGGWTNESYFKLSDVLADKILTAQF